MALNLVVTLTSDAFLSCTLLLILSMLGLRLLPFKFSNLRKNSLKESWQQIASGSSRSESRVERAIAAYYYYDELSSTDITQMQKSYAKVGRAHKRIGYELGYPAKLERLTQVTRSNAVITSSIAKLALEDIGLNISALQNASSGDLREVREALRHFVRDWCSESASERDVVLRPILDGFSQVEPERRKALKVLVPGSGLGRLAWEISELGFITSANELSPFMNLCFRFLLTPETTHTISQHTLYPYAHWFSHQRNNAALFRSVTFPDALPRLSNTFRHLSSDFLLLGPAGSYDYVVTQFFIDTSFNIISTLEQIHTLLRPGGTWVNLGPLLWRTGAQAALELGLEEVLALAVRVGFEVDEKSRKTVECEYTSDNEAMMKWIYKAEFWVAQKRPI